MAFRQVHNKYVSTPNWFTTQAAPSADSTTEAGYTSETQQNLHTGGGITSPVITNPTGGSGESLTFYNKYAIGEITVTNEILSNEDKAIVAVASDDYVVDDIVDESGWGLSNYIPIVSDTLLTITSSIHEHYGIVFYDLEHNVMQSYVLESAAQEIKCPKDCWYFRICSIIDYTDFSITYYSRESYTPTQLEQSDKNVDNFQIIDDTIPEGVSSFTIKSNTFTLLAQKPLEFTKDRYDLAKLSISSLDDVYLSLWGGAMKTSDELKLGSIKNIGFLTFAKLENELSDKQKAELKPNVVIGSFSTPESLTIKLGDPEVPEGSGEESETDIISVFKIVNDAQDKILFQIGTDGKAYVRYDLLNEDTIEGINTNRLKLCPIKVVNPMICGDGNTLTFGYADTGVFVNLSSESFNPSQDDSLILGTETERWKNLYAINANISEQLNVKTLYVNGINILDKINDLEKAIVKINDLITKLTERVEALEKA